MNPARSVHRYLDGLSCVARCAVYVVFDGRASPKRTLPRSVIATLYRALGQQPDQVWTSLLVDLLIPLYIRMAGRMSFA